MSAQSKHIDGMTVLLLLGDLDPSLVAEAEVDETFLPPLTTAQKHAQKAALRQSRASRRADNPFFRFATSGAGAVAISLVVAFAAIAIMLRMVKPPPSNDVVAPGPGGHGDLVPADSTTERQEDESLSEGGIPVFSENTPYRISTDRSLYEESPKRIILTATAKEPGVQIGYFQSATIESLSDPDQDIPAFWNDLATEMIGPLEPDEYATWSKTIHLDTTLPAGVYRIHHKEYDPDKGGYISVASVDFRVGKTAETTPQDPDTDATPEDDTLTAEHPSMGNTVPNYPEAAEGPYTIKAASMGIADTGERGYLSVTYQTTEPGEAVLPAGAVMMCRLRRRDVAPYGSSDALPAGA